MQTLSSGFVPPFCPNRACARHTAPDPDAFRRHGSFHVACRPRPEQRFRCTTCRRTFSRQTFRHDRGERRPETNVDVFKLLTSGVGLRQTGRYVGLSLRAVQGKLRRMAATCRSLHRHLCRRLPGGRMFQLDEEETFEHASIRTVTLPVCIERDSRLWITTGTGRIRRLAKQGSARRERQDREEAKHGLRPDESRQVVERALGQLRRLVPTGPVLLQTDEKPSYSVIARKLFGDRLHHDQTPGRRTRSTRNPLFAINHTLTMSRDNNGRLRRRSWLVSKCRHWLQRQLHLYVVYRNYVRRRFNRDPKAYTPARMLELLPRELSPAEVLRWRQDWGRCSIHPMCLAEPRTFRQISRESA
ncbi:MAG: hypothetical protein AB7O97_06185 [Planctomycetota bacterium]